MKITRHTLRALEGEYSTWVSALNHGIGVPSFALGISCLGTPRPDMTGTLSLWFMLLVGLYSRKDYPKTFIQLRDAKLSELDRLTRDGLRKKYLSVGAAMIHAPVYLIGWLFLGAVAAWGMLHHA